MESERLLYTLFIFIIGLFIGSFLNVIADRLHRNETFLKGRSHCENCNHPLSFFDLIPLFSFLYLGAKCRYCKIKLSWYYPFSEILTGTLFVITYITIGYTSLVLLVFYLFIISCMTIIFLSDIKFGIIPDKVVYPALVVTLFFHILIHVNFLSQFIFSALGAGAFFFLLFLITKGKGMGFGDVKFALLMGLLLGFPAIIYALYIAFLTGAFVSLILIMWGKKHVKSTVPFGPFLVLGTLAALFFLNQVEILVKLVLLS